MEREFLEGLQVPEETVNAILEKHATVVAGVRRDAAVQIAVHNAGGRNLTAIKALLDMEAFAGAEDLQSAAEEAVEQVKKAHGYLFGSAVPPYYGGGGSPIAPVKQVSLADALRLRRKRN